MSRIAALLIGIVAIACVAEATELSKATTQELLATYTQLRSLSAGDFAKCENVALKREYATFTFLTGRITFAAPVAGRVLAAYFQGEGRFELKPVSAMEKRQLSRFSKSPELSDTFREAVFYFTDNTFEELKKLVKVQVASASARDKPFSASQKKYTRSFNYWQENQLNGYPEMRNLAARMLADLTDISSEGLFLADFKGKKSGDLLFHISWDRDSLLLPHYAKNEEVILLHLNPGNSYEWWLGAHLSDEYVRSQHPDHRNLLVHCENASINLEIAANNRISAIARLEYIPAQSIRILPFNLNGVLRISAIEDEAGNKLSFIQEPREFDSDPWIILPKQAKPEGKYTITIAYTEQSTRDSRMVLQMGNGLYYPTARESWFPSFGSYDDRTQYELTIRSPKKYKIVATGIQASSRLENDNIVTSWITNIPQRVIGFNYGDFAESSQSTPDIKVTAYAGRDVPGVLKQVQSDLSVEDLRTLGGAPRPGGLGGSTARDAAARRGVAPGGFNTAANVTYAADKSSQALNYFGSLFGPLPFKAVAVTQQPVGCSGQSWPYLVFLPFTSFLDPGTRNSLGVSRGGWGRDFFTVIEPHEMSHQWWGHLVGWKTYHDQWISEGFADFSSVLFLRKFEPREVSDFWLLRRSLLLNKNSSGYRPVDAGPIWLNAQLIEQDQPGNTRDLIYYKGAYVVEMLRVLMHDPNSTDPDARFFAMLRDFTSTYAGDNASTEDFRQMVEKHTGSSMEWFFNQWVYGSDTPVYDFSYQLANAADGQTEVSISITQSGVPESFRMKLPLYVTVSGEQRYLGLVGVTGTKPMKTSLKLLVRPEKVTLDPEHSILAEIHQ